MEELRLNDPDHNPASSALLEQKGLERSIATKRELGSTKKGGMCSEETHAEQLKIQTNPANNHSEEVILIDERKWNDILAYQYDKGNTFEAKVSKLVMRLVRRHDQNERETEGTNGTVVRSRTMKSRLERFCSD